MELLVSRTELYHTGVRTTNGNISISINPPSFLLKATTHDMLYIVCTFHFQDVFDKYKYNLQGQTGFLTALLNSNPPVIAEAYPLHSQDVRKELSTMWKSSFIPFSGLNIDKIRNYFGMLY